MECSTNSVADFCGGVARITIKVYANKSQKCGGTIFVFDYFISLLKTSQKKTNFY